MFRFSASGILILLTCCFASCGSSETTQNSNPTQANEQPGIESFHDFTSLFPLEEFPWQPADEKALFNPSSYRKIPDSLVTHFLAFEPWSWRDQDTVPFYPVSRLLNSDTTQLLVYLTVDSVPPWDARYLVLCNVTNEGKLLGRFRLGESATTAQYHSLGNCDILQSGGIYNADSGYIQRKTVTDRFGERTENYMFRVDSKGGIDSEFVITEE